MLIQYGFTRMKCEYMEPTGNDGLLSFDGKDEKEGLSLARMVNMIMHVNYVSVSEAGDYYQVLFEERDPDMEQDSLDGK